MDLRHDDFGAANSHASRQFNNGSLRAKRSGWLAYKAA